LITFRVNSEVIVAGTKGRQYGRGHRLTWSFANPASSRYAKSRIEAMAADRAQVGCTYDACQRHCGIALLGVCLSWQANGGSGAGLPFTMFHRPPPALGRSDHGGDPVFADSAD
jgi:hypothetical protein